MWLFFSAVSLNFLTPLPRDGNLKFKFGLDIPDAGRQVGFSLLVAGYAVAPSNSSSSSILYLRHLLSTSRRRHQSSLRRRMKVGCISAVEEARSHVAYPYS